MSFRQKLDARRVLSGAILLGAIALAWAIERPQKPAPPAMETYPAGWTVDPEADPPLAGILRMRWPWWRAVLLETYDAMGKARLLAVAAGVVFYALLAIFPAITALVSSYGLFANAGAIQNNLSMLANVLPAGGISIMQEQIVRIAEQPSGLSIGFAAGFLVALWSANAGVKAMIDALNVIEGQDERRGFVRLNLLSLTMTLGVIVFLLLAVGAVVAFPLVMSTFGLKDFMAATTWLIRWPLLLVLMTGALTVFYRFGPSRPQPPRPWFSPGAVIAALIWLAGSAALSFYLSNFADYNATYGSLGAAIGLMMWMWLSTISVLLGAQLDTVIERKMPRPQ
ncbi:MAG: rane protein [Alphaproteobacteria bacterium]|nr:rane protein [Alphaproteobacteria bacterium]